jgi:hypothetical protein
MRRAQSCFLNLLFLNRWAGAQTCQRAARLRHARFVVMYAPL